MKQILRTDITCTRVHVYTRVRANGILVEENRQALHFSY